ncbi:MAG: response regulator transcription factor [Anaerolineae bacterium]|nr:response regulator transcription factor [Anaerolineae bacterium]
MSTNTDSASVLVVDDESAIRYSITKTLQRVGYQVDAAASGEEALQLLESRHYEVVLTDIRMPGISGVDLLAHIKKQAPDAIVILLTGYASLETAVESLRLGAHDYLVKPSSSQDIRDSVARGIERAHNLRRRRALLDAIQTNVSELATVATTATRSANAPVPAPAPNEGATPISTPVNTMDLGPLTIYPGRYQIAVGEEPIDLTPTEFDLLLYLAVHRGRVVPCHELVREVRGYSIDEPEAREVIRPHISNLRRKLKQAGQDPNLIVNVRGIGYRLADLPDSDM